MRREVTGKIPNTCSKRCANLEITFRQIEIEVPQSNRRNPM